MQSCKVVHVILCCTTNHLKTYWLKATTVLFSTLVLWVDESWPGDSGSDLSCSCSQTAAWGWSQLPSPCSRGSWMRPPAGWDLHCSCSSEHLWVVPHVVWAPPGMVAGARDTGRGSCGFRRPGPGTASLLPYSTGQAVTEPRFRTEPHLLLGGVSKNWGAMF